MAAKYPNSRILSVSNSGPQCEHINNQAKARGLKNVRAMVCDMNDFKPPEGTKQFDRVVTVEMFEHMRNWETLLNKVSTWLKPEGMMFIHVFAHKTMPYPFDDNGDSDWMSRFFFSGGMMPSHD
jgi:cyclopropane-fatty-acyl-phospholipid synthase